MEIEASFRPLFKEIWYISMLCDDIDKPNGSKSGCPVNSTLQVLSLSSKLSDFKVVKPEMFNSSKFIFINILCYPPPVKCFYLFIYFILDFFLYESKKLFAAKILLCTHPPIMT